MNRIESDADLVRAFPVMRQLRTGLVDAADFISRVREGEKRENYRLFALEKDGAIVSLCGVMPMVTLYYNRCLWVCDLVTDAAQRSSGLGAQLLGEVEAWARDNGYTEISLSSGVQRLDAHRFYQEKMAYKLVSYAFLKVL